MLVFYFKTFWDVHHIIICFVVVVFRLIVVKCCIIITLNTYHVMLQFLLAGGFGLTAGLTKSPIMVCIHFSNLEHTLLLHFI